MTDKRGRATKTESERTLLLLLALALPTWLAGSTIGAGQADAAESAAGRAREGLRQYELSNYAAAERAFTESLALDDDPRHAFNLGCAVAAQGRMDEALPWFERAATATDSSLAARAHFNIGGLRVAEARRQLEEAGDPPETLPPDQRPPVVESLRRAIDAYRASSRRMQPNPAAEENVERLRLWLDQMQAAWKQFDRQQRRETLDVPAFLQALQDDQAALREQVRNSAAEWPSPRRRQAAYDAARRQRETAEELEPLEQKFRELLSTQSDATAPAASDPTRPAATDPTSPRRLPDEALTWLSERLNNCRNQMQQAARHLEVDQWQPALQNQSAADDTLNQLYMAVVPFEQLLGKATERQQTLVDASQQAVGEPADVVQGRTTEAELPAEELARRQDRVTQWSEALLGKAQAELKQPPAESSSEPTSPGSDPDSTQSSPDEAARAAREKAVQLCPEIGRLTESASGHLRNNQVADALPDQQRALELLQEIARSLPPPPQDQQQQDDQQQDKQQQDKQQQDQQQQDKQQQDKQQQDKQQQDKQQQDKQQQDKQQQDKQQQDKQQQDKQQQDQQQQDQQQQDKQQQDKQQQDQQQQDQQQQDKPQQDKQQQDKQQQDKQQQDKQQQDKQQQPGSPTPAEQQETLQRQADAVLQRARERQRQYAELQRQLQRLLRGSARSGRDW